jgi:hypothetical protein
MFKLEEDGGIPFEVKMKGLTSQLREQMEEGLKLDKDKENLEGIGFKV